MREEGIMRGGAMRGEEWHRVPSVNGLGLPPRWCVLWSCGRRRGHWATPIGAELGVLECSSPSGERERRGEMIARDPIMHTRLS